MPTGRRVARASLGQRFSPTATELIDGSFALGLSLLAIVGFRSSYGGAGFFVVGAIASVVGVLTAHAVRRLRPGLLPAAAITLGIFILVGSAAVRSDLTIGGVIPTPESFRGLTDGLVRGWAKLLTTLPPTGGVDNLLAIPYLCGFVAGFAGMLLATGTRWLLPVVVPSCAALAVVILFGTSEPTSLVIQGGILAVAALAWMSLRRRGRRAVVVTGTRRSARFVGIVAMLAVALVGSVGLGPRLPLAEANERLVLREDVRPPFDPRDHGSPLATFRKYRKELKDEVILTVDRVPEGVTRVRLASMDDYDLLVWNVGGGGRRGGGYFERAGETLPVVTEGVQFEARLTVGALEGVWLPAIGTTTAISFAGDRAESIADGLRYNSFSGAVASSAGLAAGDELLLTGVVETLPEEDALNESRVDTGVFEGNEQLPPAFGSFAASLVTGASTPYEQAKQLELALQQGAFSDGGPDAVVPSPPGHSAGRLVDFIDGQLVGNGEQYAATMAVLARTLSLPARVVMGFEVEPGATDVTVHGEAVDAWVEIKFEGAGWVPFFPTPPETNQPQPEVKLERPQPQVETQIPPPVSNPPTPTTLPKDDEELQDPPEREVSDTGGGLPLGVLLIAGAVLLPVLLLALFVLGVLAAKRRRRSKRRTRGSPSDRIAGAWDELLDDARDQQRSVPPRSTRREVAPALGGSGPELAAVADSSVFGPDDPADTDAVEYWAQVDGARAELRSELGVKGRVKAATSRASLRGGG